MENEPSSGEPLALNYWTRGEANHWDPAAGIGCKPIPRFDSWSWVDLHSQALRFLRTACAILPWPARSLDPFPRSKSHAIRIQGLLRFLGISTFCQRGSEPARPSLSSISTPFLFVHSFGLRCCPHNIRTELWKRQEPGIATASTVPPTRSLALDCRSRIQPPYKRSSVAAASNSFPRREPLRERAASQCDSEGISYRSWVDIQLPRASSRHIDRHSTEPYFRRTIGLSLMGYGVDPGHDRPLILGLSTW